MCGLVPKRPILGTHQRELRKTPAAEAAMLSASFLLLRRRAAQGSRFLLRIHTYFETRQETTQLWRSREDRQADLDGGRVECIGQETLLTWSKARKSVRSGSF